MLRLLRCVTITIFCLILTCYVQGQRRLLVDDNADLSSLVAKLTLEVVAKAKEQSITKVEHLKLEQNNSLKYINRLQQDVQKLKTDLANTKTDLASATSAVQQLSASDRSWSTYVHWGTNNCPDGETELVYSGYAGGSSWDDSGSATDFLCLVQDPHLIGNSSFNKGAQVFGAEYILDNGNWQETSRRLFGQDMTYQDVPCAVCRIPRATVLMVPGKNTCAAGWTLEYEGLLSSGFYDHPSGSEFVCLDRHPVALQGTDSKQLGKLFYVAEAVCGSLKCPPYESGKELTCAVCSK